MSRFHAFVLGAILNLLFNVTAGLVSRDFAIRATRWGWLYFLLHATLLLLLARPVKSALQTVARRLTGGKAVLGYVIVGVIGAVVALGYWTAINGVYSRLFAKPGVRLADNTTTKEDIPTILVRYTQLELPIPVPPRSSVPVLQLTPHVQDQTLEVFNDSPKQIWWPTKRPRNPDKEPLVGYVYACELQNNSDKAFLDITMLFDLKFLSVEPVKASVKRNAGGTNSISVDMDTTRKDDPMSFAFVDAKKRVIAGTSGKLVSEHKHTVTIPVIKAHNTVTVYLVSQSRLFSQFTLPDTATVVIDGNPTRRIGALIRPAMSPVDKIPKWGLQPSTYKWPGVPESALNLDAFVAQRSAR